MLNPLLVQLFGRDVVDRLENAGLATDDAVAQLGPEELSTRADIAPDDVKFDGMRISSMTGQGLPELLGRMADAVKEAREAEAERSDTEFVIHRPLVDHVTVEKIADDQYVVHGRSALRAVRLSDLNEPGALDYAHKRLDSIGVNKALRRAGAREGDPVHIGDLAFEYEEEQ